MYKNEMEIWEEHWSKLSKKGFFAKFLYLYRKYILANSVAFYLDKYFPADGMFIECGSGTSQTSIKIPKFNRNLIALDISHVALLEARKLKVMDFYVNADISKLPFKDGSIDGIWNVGVMEHFALPEMVSILTEFRRVLKENAVCILFWPPAYAPYQRFLGSIVSAIDMIFKKKIMLFPAEPSRLHSKSQAKEIVLNGGFSECSVSYSIRDLFTFYAVICRK